MLGLYPVSGQAFSATILLVSVGPGYGQGLREYQRDFISQNVLVGESSVELRPDAIAFNHQIAFSAGPRAIGDVTAGVADRPWYVRVDNDTGTVYIAKANDANTAWAAETELFTFSGAPIVELDLAFEQAARAVVCAQRGTEIWLYWFDPGESDFIFEKIDDGRTPKVVLDDVEDTSGADVQLMYFKDPDGLLRREQRELYAIANATPIAWDENYYLEELAITKSRRLVAIYSYRDVGRGRWFLRRVQSDLYPVYPEDTLTSQLDIIDGELIVALINHNLYDKDSLESAVDILDTSVLAPIVIDHVLYDKDELESELDILEAGSDLDVVVIVEDLYDIDELESELDILTTSTFLVVVIVHTLFDKDSLSASLSIRDTSTLEVA